MNELELKLLVDQLVHIDTAYKSLEKRRDDLKKQIISAGEGKYFGESGSVTISIESRVSMSQEKVKELLTPEQLENCYATTKSVVCRVTGYK